MSLRGFSMPDEFYFLCMLHNIGATSSEKSLTFEEITMRTAIESDKARSNLQQLIDGNYVETASINGIEKYHMTAEGIRKVLSMYS